MLNWHRPGLVDCKKKGFKMFAGIKVGERYCAQDHEVQVCENSGASDLYYSSYEGFKVILPICAKTVAARKKFPRR